MSKDRNSLKSVPSCSAASYLLSDGVSQRLNVSLNRNLRKPDLCVGEIVGTNVERKAVDATLLSKTDVLLPSVDAEGGCETNDVMRDHELRNVGGLTLQRSGVNERGSGEEANGVESRAEEHVCASASVS